MWVGILSSKDTRLLTTFLHEANYRNLSFEEKVPSVDSSVDRDLCMMAWAKTQYTVTCRNTAKFKKNKSKKKIDKK